MGWRSSVLIVVLVFGILFSTLYVSQITHSPPAMGIKTRPTLTEDDVTEIARSNLKMQVSPAGVDRFVLFPKYYGHPLPLMFIHSNGTLYSVGSTNGQYIINHSCTGDTCNLRDVNHLLRGHLFYIVDGSWQDGSARNCSPFIYAVDANSGEILWSYIGDVANNSCQVQPPGW